MTLAVVLVVLTLALAVNLALSGAADSVLRRGRGRRKHRPRTRWPHRDPSLQAGRPRGQVPSRTLARLDAADTESVLVAMLLAGRLSPADYQRQMADLAAAESARAGHGRSPSADTP